MKAAVAKILILKMLAVFFAASMAFAQHPSQVEQDHQHGDHFSAMLNFDRIPKRKIDAESRLTVANSAWALSLPDRAISEFEQALYSSTLNSEEQQRARLSLAIINLQEQKADQALVIARKLAEEIGDSSPLSARTQILIGQCLIAMGLKAQAEENFSQAFIQAGYDERPEIAYQLGELLSQLGRWDEAESYLRTIKLEDLPAPQAKKLLLEISFNKKNFTAADQYLKDLSQYFPQELKDPWVYYARGSLAINGQDLNLLQEVLKEAQLKLAPSDGWLNILQADHEIYLAHIRNAKKEDL